MNDSISIRKDKMKKRTYFTLGFSAFLLGLSILFTGCAEPLDAAIEEQSLPETVQTDEQTTIDMAPVEKDTTYPDLSSRLYQLVQAYENGTAVEYAEAENIYIADGKVFVTVFVSHNETAAAKKEIRAVGGDIKGSFGREIDAMIPIDKLCELSDKDCIASIKLPASDTAT